MVFACWPQQNHRLLVTVRPKNQIVTTYDDNNTLTAPRKAGTLPFTTTWISSVKGEERKLGGEDHHVGGELLTRADLRDLNGFTCRAT